MSEPEYLAELLTPRQIVEDIDSELERFAVRLTTLWKVGLVPSVPDNPMGTLHYQATEILQELGVAVSDRPFMLHINTFHTLAELDSILSAAAGLGIRRLLVVTGDGGERLTKLRPSSLGIDTPSVTSVELLKHIITRHDNRFVCGVAFNPYEPPEHELEKLRRKLDAGASFVVTQPVFGRDARLTPLEGLPVPIYLGAWMSPKIDRLTQCVGYDLPGMASYDPMANLRQLRERYPRFGIYLALLSFKTQMEPVTAFLRARPAA